jgi:hypothetical protein
MGTAVDKTVSARGNYEAYRPHESPANSRNSNGAGDAGDTLPSLAVLDPRPFLSVSTSDDQGALKAAFNAFVADERTVDGPGT